MHREKKLKALKLILGEYRLKNDEAIFFCNKHSSRVGRVEGQLCVNLKTDWFNCWSCGFKGRNIIPILRQGNKEFLSEYIDSISQHHEITESKVYSTPALPHEFKTLSTSYRSLFYNAAMNYLTSRNVSLDDIVYWKLGYCESGPYKHRIVIPSFDEHGLLNFIVGRSFLDQNLRFKIENLDKNIIWNDYMIDWKRPITITEGAFDAFVVHDNVTILQGTILNKSLFNKIIMAGIDVYFALDADAIKKQLKYISLLVTYGIRCHHVDVKGKKDVGEMTRQEFNTRKSNAKVITDELDILKLRVAI